MQHFSAETTTLVLSPRQELRSKFILCLVYCTIVAFATTVCEDLELFILVVFLHDLCNVLRNLWCSCAV